MPPSSSTELVPIGGRPFSPTLLDVRLLDEPDAPHAHHVFPPGGFRPSGIQVFPSCHRTPPGAPIPPRSPPLGSSSAPPNPCNALLSPTNRAPALPMTPGMSGRFDSFPRRHPGRDRRGLNHPAGAPSLVCPTFAPEPPPRQRVGRADAGPLRVLSPRLRRPAVSCSPPPSPESNRRALRKSSPPPPSDRAVPGLPHSHVRRSRPRRALAFLRDRRHKRAGQTHTRSITSGVTSGHPTPSSALRATRLLGGGLAVLPLDILRDASILSLAL